ncbi:MAG TPA: helix-turn-helix transcriptional regulator [Rhodocyclaceae bacterium]|nr:helix-turn-helix transcriptional regulator [Rhodocyclaceae bacterium]
MIDENHELDRLAGQLFQGILMPEMQSEVIASLVAWLQSPLDTESADERGAHSPPSYCPLSTDGNPGNAYCRRKRLASDLPAPAENPCTVCALLDGNRPNWQRIIDLFVHCRALREFSDQAASWAHTSHVAAIILTQNARILDCDYRAQSFLKAGNVLHMVGGQLYCTDAKFQPNFNSALKETAGNGRTANILLHPPEQPDKRFSLTLTRMQPRLSAAKAGEAAKIPHILCLVAPLDGRRIATARQLMDFFQLSAAEARLARAICHGDSVEEYARDQGLRLPTVRTQLSSIFNKTGTERQASLVRLIAGIPVVRDSA